jgi:hypothetical protein
LLGVLQPLGGTVDDVIDLAVHVAEAGMPRVAMPTSRTMIVPKPAASLALMVKRMV